ncbi:MAG: hypothetical protein ACLQU4_05370 [Limisphaerales bacterium]
MNRIYQGRVSRVEIPNPGDKENPWQPLPNWQDILWQHHELFQDAVNYYIVALASLGRSPDSPMTKQLDRISAVWTCVEKQGKRREGMGASLARRFALPTNEAPLSRIIELAHDGGFPYASGPGLWKHVNSPAFQWKRCSEINRRRMEKPRLKTSGGEEDNPLT